MSAEPGVPMLAWLMEYGVHRWPREQRQKWFDQQTALAPIARRGRAHMSREWAKVHVSPVFNTGMLSPACLGWQECVLFVYQESEGGLRNHQIWDILESDDEMDLDSD